MSKKPWSEMTDKEKSDDINRSIEHHAKHGPDIRRPEETALREIAHALNLELAAGGPARDTFEHLLTQNHTRETAFALMFEAKTKCILETEYGMPDRWLAVVGALREGRTVKELFPKSQFTVGGKAN